MSRVVEFDFSDAPPAQGGGGVQHIPRGRYPITVTEITDGMSSTGKRMITALYKVAAGEQEGSPLRDNFVLGGDQKFGMQRFHAFLIAITGSATPLTKVKIDWDKLVGRSCEAEVGDDTIPAREGFPERLTSRVNSYYILGSANGNGVAPAAEVVAAVAPAPAPAAAPVVAEAVAEVAVTQEPAPAAQAEVGKSIDDLFA